MNTRKTSIIASLALGAVLASASASAGQRTHEIRDEYGFDRPMTAVTVTLPDGWDVKGTVQWTGLPSCQEPMKMSFMATSPDRKQWVELIPGGMWGWSSNFDAMPHTASEGFAGCRARPITDIQSFVNDYIPTIRPGARIVTVRPRPDHAQTLLQSMGNINLQPGQYPRMEVMEVRLEYESKGETVNELLMPAVLFIDQRAMDMWGGMNGYSMVAMAVGTFATATVNGQADEALLNFVGKGLQHNPQYMQRVSQLYQQRARVIAAATERKRKAQVRWLEANQQRINSQIAANNAARSTSSGETANDVIANMGKNISKMKDVGHAKTVDSIHEQTAWADSDNNLHYFPQQYGNAFQAGNDMYYATNDAFFGSESLQRVDAFVDPMRRYNYGN